jgi:hypothetical protein
MAIDETRRFYDTGLARGVSEVTLRLNSTSGACAAAVRPKSARRLSAAMHVIALTAATASSLE